MSIFAGFEHKSSLLAIFFGFCFSNLFVYGNTAAREASSEYYCNFSVTGYYPDFYALQMPVSDIRYDKLTDIVYFSIYPNPDGSLNTSEILLSRQQELIHTAHMNNVKVSICVGGWGLSDNFSFIYANPSTRSTFINNVIQYCLTYGFDGVDLDWEPVSTATDCTGSA